MSTKGKRSAMRQLTRCGGSIIKLVGVAGSKISVRAALKNSIPRRISSVPVIRSPITYSLCSQGHAL